MAEQQNVSASSSKSSLIKGEKVQQPSEPVDDAGQSSSALRLYRSESPTSGLKVTDFAEELRELEWSEEEAAFQEILNTAIYKKERSAGGDRHEFNHTLLETLNMSWDEQFIRFNSLPISLIPLTRNYSLHPLREVELHHCYDTIYRGAHGSSTNVLIKVARSTLKNRKIVAHEHAMISLFPNITPNFKALQLNSSRMSFKFGVEFYPENLRDLMDKRDLQTNWNVAAELFRVMSEIEERGYLLRDYRLENFRVTESKIIYRKKCFASLI